MLSISCPHCGATRNTPRSKRPANKSRARCPECRKTFIYDPNKQCSDTRAHEKTGQIVCCPQCGLERHIPSGRQPDKLATLTCRRCQHAFRLDTGYRPDPATELNKQHLTGIGVLFTNTWELFCRRGWGLLTLYLLGSLLILLPLLTAAYTLPGMLKDQHILAWTVLVTGIIYASLGAAWMSASMFHHIADEKLGVIAALAQGWRNLWKFAWLLLLVVLLLSGGSLLLLIPGLIFMIWFSVCQYVLADEGVGGLGALQRSRQLVRGHWWQVFSRFCLLLLAGLALSTLAERLPVIGMPLSFLISLLLTPFSLLYYSLIYQDLKQLHKSAPATRPQSAWLPLVCALLGWLLVPALALLLQSHTGQPPSAQLSGPARLFHLLSSQGPSLAELTAAEEILPQQPPQHLNAKEYEQLLSNKRLPALTSGISLGPARLSAEQFWSDDLDPHLWLKVELAELPNLALSPRRTARIQIDQVLDKAAQNHYNPQHSFENSAFHWIEIYPEAMKENYAGIRNIYLTQGTNAEQLRTISGQLQLSLPLGIESLELRRQDIGKTIAIAGTTVQLEEIEQGRVVLHYQGNPLQVLNIQAFDLQKQPLQQAGTVWKSTGNAAILNQMFAGDVDFLKLLVAADSVTRSYPFTLNL